MTGHDYAHWHSMWELAARIYQEQIREAREIAHQAEEAGQKTKAGAADHAAVAVPADEALVEVVRPACLRPFL